MILKLRVDLLKPFQLDGFKLAKPLLLRRGFGFDWLFLGVL